MSKNHGEGPKMRDAASVLNEARQFVIRAGGPREHFDSKASWLHRAAARLGLPFGRASSLYYGKARTIPAHEYLELRAKLEELERSAELRREILDDTKDLLLAGAAARSLGARPREESKPAGAQSRTPSSVRMAREE